MSTAPLPVRVLIADDHALFRAGMVSMLRREPRVDVVGQAADGKEAVEQALIHAPDVVLMDLHMPNVDGVEATRRLSREAPHVRVLVLSGYANGATVGEALAIGAQGFLNKDATVQEVISGILAASSSSRAPGSKPAVGSLSDRELHVLRHVAVGLSNKQVARQLGISEKTVRNHLSRIFGKLSVATRTEAVVAAIRVGTLIV